MSSRTNSESLKSKLSRSLEKKSSVHEENPAEATPGAKLPHASSVSTDEQQVSLDVTSRLATADRIIITSSLVAAGGGAIPLPVWDIVAVAGVQLKMLADLSKIYDTPFSQDIGKSAVGVLIGGLGPNLLARGSLGSAVKLIPGVGQLVGMVALPVLAGGCTYALGRIFVAHYESGGTLLTFKPKEFSSRFALEVKEGMKKIASIKI
jgi:uncharacterized protein (DUF697 family)